MDALVPFAVIIVLFVVALKVPLGLVIGYRPIDVPREWPIGVQEEEPITYRVELLTPRASRVGSAPRPDTPPGRPVGTATPGPASRRLPAR